MTDEQQIKEEGPLADAKRLEPEITGRSRDVLHKLRRQLSRSQQQQALDKYIELLAPTFAFGGMGSIRIPMTWRPGGVIFEENWWKCLMWEASRLVITYWDLIAEGNWKEWEAAVERLEKIVDKGVGKYLLAPKQPNGWYLVTKEEWKMELRKRARKQKLLDRQRSQ